MMGHSGLEGPAFWVCSGKRFFLYSVPLQTLVTSEAAAVKNEQKGILQLELFS